MKTDLSELSHGKSYCSCFVGFFDILGFSKIVETRPFQDAYAKIFQFLHLSNLTREFGGEPTESRTIKSDEDHPIIKSVAISDSLLLFTDDVSARSLRNLLQTASVLVGVGMQIHLPIRGAISFGDFFWDFQSRIFIGPALSDAVSWEKKAQWAGVLLTPTCADHVCGKQEYQEVLTHRLEAKQGISSGKVSASENTLTITAPLVTEYEVPLKVNGLKKQSLKCINWTCFSLEFDPGMNWLARTFFWVGADEEDVQTKYENTKDFLIHCSHLKSQI